MYGGGQKGGGGYHWMGEIQIYKSIKEYSRDSDRTRFGPGSLHSGRGRLNHILLELKKYI